jgi:hypothetical protein
MRARPQPRLHAGDVARVDRQHQVGSSECALDGAMAWSRRPLGAARRVRSLDEGIGNAQRPGHDRPQPVGLAVIAVVGEPEIKALGMARRQGAPARDQPLRLRAHPPFKREMILRCGHARRDAAQRRHHHGVIEPAQQSPQTARHLTIARGDGTVRRFQRRVQQHAHGYSAALASDRMASRRTS